ncbi:extracellular solute-binding protein [Demequina mangrovi]|uniref:Carbohydrate ABC transporter substrate-binding protein, CUT1 family n=1 Tax=Demequina mangrovi TaxID=1043493 RepID=A0A1H6WA00_9MICO|nr:extracellular solute-binding protein [Demequina mangrovi]SEJ10857.1 carbohydrate ABC transporter substrate-binding protein, CUT1 family [Demequina mangrovi]
MKKTMYGTIAMGAATALLVAGCSSGDSDSSASGSDGSSGGGTELLLWHGYTEADGKVLEKIVNAFNDQSDMCTVKQEPIAWSSITEKLVTSLGAGNGPNLVVQGVDTGEGYKNQGAFLSMDAYYSSGEYESADLMYSQAKDQVTWDGEAYGVPMGTTPFALWYNTELWEAAGLTDADYPTTIDELIEVAKKLTIDENGDGEPEQYGFAMPDQDMGVFSTLLHSGGGDYITDGVPAFDSAENVATMEKWQEAFVDGMISPTGMDSTAAMELFGSGRAAMIFNGPWEITSAESFGVDIGGFGWPSDWVAGVYNYWYATSMNDTDEEMTCSLEFSDFWNSYDQQIIWTESYYPPNRTDIDIAEIDDPLVSMLSEMAPTSYYYATGIDTNISDIQSESNAAQQQILAGGDVQELLTTAQTKIAGYLDN